MTKRSDAKTQVGTYKTYFQSYIAKEMVLKFDKHCFPIVIHDVRLAKLTELVNKPSSRIDIDGKKYRPPVMEVETNVGMLYFVLEDTSIVMIFNGLRIETGLTAVEIRHANTAC